MPCARCQLGYRIDIERVDPVRAEIVGNVERAGVGHAAAADVVGGFDQHEVSAGGGEPACGGNPRRSGADDHDIGGGRAGRRQLRTQRGAISAAEAARKVRRLTRDMVSKFLQRDRLPECPAVRKR